MWYMDCYCPAAILGDEFPVNSYYSESLMELMEAGENLLLREGSGIGAVRFSRKTKGQSPIPLVPLRSVVAGPEG